MRHAGTLVLVVLATSSVACHTMRFDVGDEPIASTVTERKAFFLWGLAPTCTVDVLDRCPDGVVVPSERVIDAGRQCGGADQVAEIRTEERFVQGLIAVLASYYVNIYSPWNGEVVCRGTQPQ